VDTPREHGDDREIGTVTEESGGDDPTPRVQTPEEIAREFLRSGQVLVDAEPEEPIVRRNWAPLVGLVVVCVILAVIVAFVLISTRHASHPPAPAAAVRPHASTTVAVKPVTSTTRSTTSTTSQPSQPANSAVLVTVLNASDTDGLAAQTGAGLTADGFTVSSVGTAPSPIAPGDPSQILYGPSGLSAAHVLGGSLSGPISYVASPGLAGTNVTLMIASSQLTVVSGTTTTTTGSTTTSSP
jgi:LytR cell envelope-related transcriptional attenuator